MKQAEVVVGKQYTAYVSGVRIKVEVMAKVKDYRGRIKFQCRNVATSRPLPALRSAAALREIPKLTPQLKEVVNETISQWLS